MGNSLPSPHGLIGIIHGKAFTAGLVEDTAKAFGFRPPISRATVDKYTEDITVSGEKIRTALGFKPEYDLSSGWKETIQEMRKNGDL